MAMRANMDSGCIGLLGLVALSCSWMTGWFLLDRPLTYSRQREQGLAYERLAEVYKIIYPLR